MLSGWGVWIPQETYHRVKLLLQNHNYNHPELAFFYSFPDYSEDFQTHSLRNRSKTHGPLQQKRQENN